MISVTRVLDLHRDEGSYRCYLAVVRGSLEMDKVDLVLSQAERCRYQNIANSRRRESFLLGRYAAKLALSEMTCEQPMSEITIHSGVFGFPVVEGEANKDIGISHTKGAAVSVAYPACHPIAVDIETHQQNTSFIWDTLTSKEREFVNDGTNPIILWSAKEAIAKALRTGFTSPIALFEVAEIKKYSGFMECYFTNFYQYKSFCLELKQYVLTLCVPRYSHFESGALQQLHMELSSIFEGTY